MRRLPLVGLICLLAASACSTAARNPSSREGEARAALSPEPMVPTCGADCFGILRAAVSWASEKESVSPARVLLDTVRSGRSSYSGPRLVPRSALDDLTVATAIGGEVAAVEVGHCFYPLGPVPASCRAFEDKVVVTPHAPIVSPDNPTQASLDIALEWGLVSRQQVSSVTSPTTRNGRLWVMNAYRLTLERGASGWRVVGAELRGQT